MPILDILIYQFVHMQFSDGTLSILLYFKKLFDLQKTWMKLNQVHWHILFLKTTHAKRNAFRKQLKYSLNLILWP